MIEFASAKGFLFYVDSWFGLGLRQLNRLGHWYVMCVFVQLNKDFIFVANHWTRSN